MTPWQNLFKTCNNNQKGDHFTSSAFWLGPFMTKMNTLEMTAGNVFNLQDFEQNKIKLKQRSSEDFIGTSFVLIDADLFLILMNKFQLWFRFRRELCSVLPAVLIISWGECSLVSMMECHRNVSLCICSVSHDKWTVSFVFVNFPSSILKISCCEFSSFCPSFILSNHVYQITAEQHLTFHTIIYY